MVQGTTSIATVHNGQSPGSVTRARPQPVITRAQRRGALRQVPSCSTVDPELFFGPADSPGAGSLLDWERRALAVCAGCPVVASCLAQALEFPVDEQYGVVGGATAGQRRAVLRASGRWPARTAVAEEPTALAVSLYEAGVGARRIAQRLGVGERRVHRWLQRHRAGQRSISHRPGRAGVGVTAPRAPATVPVIQLACTACQLVYTPDPAVFGTGNTGCPRCGGWTWTARLAATDVAGVGVR